MTDDNATAPPKCPLCKGTGKQDYIELCDGRKAKRSLRDCPNGCKGAGMMTRPTYYDDRGVKRFKANAVVCWLLDSGRVSLNDVATAVLTKQFDCPIEDQREFWQMLGYSVDGYCDLSFSEAQTEETGRDEQEAEPPCPLCGDKGYIIKHVPPPIGSGITYLIPESQPCPNGCKGTSELTVCQASRGDGECHHALCPQARDGEPAATGRPCPLPHWMESAS